MKLNMKAIAVFFIVVFLLSRTRQITDWVRHIYDMEILTLEPIRHFPDDARAAITVVFFCAIFVIIWRLVLKK